MRFGIGKEVLRYRQKNPVISSSDYRRLSPLDQARLLGQLVIPLRSEGVGYLAAFTGDIVKVTTYIEGGAAMPVQQMDPRIGTHAVLLEGDTFQIDDGPRFVFSIDGDVVHV
ncbi:MAG TPA: hypothetical protein DIS62_04665, partial [Candidatus Kerfeldbacteria bacterium]|nr:hypothetical protein [Candidatus Kerfeldbacteria bacterium]